MTKLKGRKAKSAKAIRAKKKSFANNPVALVGALKMRPACQYVGGINVATMRRLIDRGLIRPNRSLRHLVFPIAELDRYLQEGVAE